MVEIKLNPIGVVHTVSSDDMIKSAFKGVDGIIEIFPEYADGLIGIDGFSHIILIAYLHKVTNENMRTLKIRHRRLQRLGISIDDLPEVGVFCSDSPHRPNPIALTIVQLVKREDRFLHVKNLDLFNETPILDIKPYTPDRIVKEIKLPQWYVKIHEHVRKILGDDACV
ncbi:MAG: tRNA (N6-threonylcarbamoyladenosine(37)-N6)-methyltransferase TrmO [Thermoprotei archaeon]|jgi:tRNA-Thr(GGU) m(6)t(6)A37 methyltransferase TsaA